jgi:manganese oxidase
MKQSRRDFIRNSSILGLGIGAAALASTEVAEAEAETNKASGTSRNRREIVPVQTPDLEKLPFAVENGVKVFHLKAQVVEREILPASKMQPGKKLTAWGYNGSVPGPLIEVVEGDRVRVVFHNELPEPTTVHWHGLEVPVAMDGVPFISQPLVEPGAMFVYEFTVNQNGTFFYHSHGPMQEMMGMLGMFVAHPRIPQTPRIDKDFGLVLQAWWLLPNNTIPDTLAMEFNWLTLNGKAGPATTPMIVKQGERVRIRMVNIGMDHHPMHLHGNQFYVTGTEGGRIPQSAWYPGNTVIVGVAQSRDIEFDAKYVGDWMLHCHLPHHMMNQMIAMVGPNPHLTHGKTPEQARAAKRVPGYPQDMVMIMDEAVAKPETYGLAPGWTAAMMGMMTLIRVLPPDKYDDIMARIKEGRVEKPTPAHRHNHE